MSEVKKLKLNISWKDYTSYIGLIILVILSCILSDNFLTTVNIVNIFKQVVVASSLAMGMTYVILLGGIDISVGSVIALFGTMTAFLLQDMGWIPAVLICLAAGVVMGGFHGIMVAHFGVAPFIVTLAGQTAYKGLALLLTNAAAVKIDDPTFLAIGADNIPVTGTIAIFVAAILWNLYSALIRKKRRGLKEIGYCVFTSLVLAAAGLLFCQYGGLPICVLIVVILYLILSTLLNDTVCGAELYAIGGNIFAAKMAGVKTKKRTITAYVICSFCAAVGAILTASRLGSGAPQSGTLGEMDAIAAVVVGGTSMTGGVGKIRGTIVGVFLIGVLNNMFSLLGVSAYMQQIFKGVIILAAVLLDIQLNKESK